MERKPYHLGELLENQARKYQDRACLHYRDDEKEQWIPISWNEFDRKARDCGKALVHAGIGIQENIGVFSQNKPEFLYTYFAAYNTRSVGIPLYATSSESQVSYIVNDAGIRLLFVGDQQQYDTAFRVHTLCPCLERIVIFNGLVEKNAQDTTSVYFKEFITMWNEDDAREYDARHASLTDEDVCNILYTSGTTGDPKGVLLHHAGFRDQFISHFKELPHLSDKDKVFDFLPLTHVFESAWTFLCLEIGSEVYVNHNPKDALKCIKEVRPSSMCNVPRFWEKVYDGVMEKIASFSPGKRRMAEDAIAIGRKYNIEYRLKGLTPPFWLSVKYAFYDRTIFAMLKKAVGLERGKFYPVAGAAMPKAVEEFVLSVGIPVIIGYGLTESTATISCDRGRKTVGSMGRPLPHLQIKFSEEGEIMVKGGSITRGYYKKDDATKSAFDEDGFFHTGDAGYMKDGELFMTDRIKDLFKTSNGKYIAPQVIEGKLCVDKYIDQIAVIADQRKFVSALIVPEYNQIRKFAEDNGIVYSTMRELLDDERIRTLYKTRIDTLQQEFAHYEQIKRFTLLAEPFSMERGELTNTLKIRRSVLLKNYSDEIGRMYED